MSHLSSTLAELYAPIEQDLASVVQVMDEELQSRFGFVNELCTHIRGFRGKMLRPALLLLCAEAVGGVRRPTHHVLGAVVELVHMATLVHDDVLDEADMRRRQLSVNSLTGNEAAVMLGDYLISHAFHLCSSLESQEASRLVGSTTNAVCEGELMQIHTRGRVDISQEDYYAIIERKTAILTATSCALGARHAGADDETVERLNRFGLEAGLAFQIVDDVLDIVGVENRVGKTLGRDVAMGKATLPIIHALQAVEPGGEHDIRPYIRDTQHDHREELAAALRRVGSIDYAFQAAQNHIANARSMAAELPQSAARDTLLGLVEFILQRDI